MAYFANRAVKQNLCELAAKVEINSGVLDQFFAETAAKLAAQKSLMAGAI